MRALVFVGGELGDVVATDLPPADFVIAADSGLHHAITLSVAVDVLVGDMDSVDPTLVGDVVTQQFPTDKDATDTELAMQHALERGADNIVVVGGLGGRVDHWFGVMLGLANDAFATATVSAIMGRTRVYVVRDAIEIAGEAGDTISQFATNGNVYGLTATGFKWPLENTTLEFGSSRGVSNVLIDEVCNVTLESGTLMVIHELGPRHSVLTRLK